MVKIASSVLFIASLFAAATAAPADVTVAEPLAALAQRAQENHCQNSSFENRWSGASPSVSDCRQLAANIGGGGDWTQSGFAHREIASYGSCQFGVEAVNIGAQMYKVGNTDVIDLINDSINRFQRDGKVQARGVMPCNAVGGGSLQVRWGIY